jgi:hypothetical protein
LWVWAVNDANTFGPAPGANSGAAWPLSDFKGSPHHSEYAYPGASFRDELPWYGEQTRRDTVRGRVRRKWCIGAKLRWRPGHHSLGRGELLAQGEVLQGELDGGVAQRTWSRKVIIELGFSSNQS